jgi:hypothetical protein
MNATKLTKAIKELIAHMDEEYKTAMVNERESVQEKAGKKPYWLGIADAAIRHANELRSILAGK